MSMKKETEAKGLPASEPVALAEIVSYQEASIISRTLVKRKGGTVTLFAFDTGQSLSEHTAPFDAVVQIIEGDAELVIGGEKVMALEGQTVLMPANIPHAVSAPKRFKMLLVMIREAVG